MELAEYWLRRPEPCNDLRTAEAFDRLLERALADGPECPIDYQLGAPKWQFLCHAADQANLVLHGSGDPGIGLFEPRQPADPLEFSSRCAVFAAVDGIWPMYYAILDRDRHPMMLLNSCVRVCSETGKPSDPYYFFSISDAALRQRPWRTGMVYLLPGDSFELQPQLTVGEGNKLVLPAVQEQYRDGDVGHLESPRADQAVTVVPPALAALRERLLLRADCVLGQLAR